MTAVAFLNTDVAASFAAVTWMVVGWWQEKRPTFVGLLTGAVAGLATITPAAGYVSPIAAVIIGIAAGVVCYFAVALKNRLRWDDALDVWGVHGVGGALGDRSPRRLRHHRFQSARRGRAYRLATPPSSCKQLVAIALSSVWAFGFTYGDAVADRPRHAGEGRSGGGGERARRRASRRIRLFGDLIDDLFVFVIPAKAGIQGERQDPEHVALDSAFAGMTTERVKRHSRKEDHAQGEKHPVPDGRPARPPGAALPWPSAGQGAPSRSARRRGARYSRMPIPTAPCACRRALP